VLLSQLLKVLSKVLLAIYHKLVQVLLMLQNHTGVNFKNNLLVTVSMFLVQFRKPSTTSMVQSPVAVVVKHE
jgi:hypothetical protein